SRPWLRRWRSADRWPSAWRGPVVSAPRRPCRARPGRSRRGIPVGGGEPRAAAAQVVELALHALLGGLRLLGAVAVGQLLEHLRLAAGQQQARALDVAELAALVDDPGLLHHRSVEPFAEGEAVDQQRRRDRRIGGRGRVLGGIAAQGLEPLLLFAQRALALGDVARGGVLALLHDPEQRV